MLVMNIDLWPLGDKNQTKTLAKLTIANVGPSVSKNSNHYDYVWYYFEPNPLNEEVSIEKYGVIRKHDRFNPTYKLINKVMSSISRNSLGIISEREMIIINKIKEKINV